MKKKNKTTTFENVLGIGGAFLIAKFLFFPSMSREEAIKILQSAGHKLVASANQPITQGSDYLISWARSIQKRTAQFKVGKGVYNTETGKRIS